MEKHNIGKHFILDINNVWFNKFYKFDEKYIEDFIVELISKNWLNVLSSNFHFFWNIKSFTWVVLLSESHFSIHTWPEFSYVSMDLFSCNLSKDLSTNIEIILKELLSEFFDGDILVDKKIINR